MWASHQERLEETTQTKNLAYERLNKSFYLLSCFVCLFFASPFMLFRVFSINESLANLEGKVKNRPFENLGDFSKKLR